MSIISGTAKSAGGGYQIARSLRFRSSNLAYMHNTFSTPTNATTWTYSTWLKRGASASTGFMMGYFTGANAGGVTWNVASADAFGFYCGDGTQTNTTGLYRDYSAWYHVVWSYDGTTSKIYVNGTNVYSVADALTLFNTAQKHGLGAYSGAAQGLYFDGLMAEVCFVDGQALTPTSFGATDATTGAWVPKNLSSLYASIGNNGFHLDMYGDGTLSATTGVGADKSGAGNHWTPVNISVTAGSTNDSLVDTPTNYGTDAVAGGVVRGNYATFNPLSKNSRITLSNGNLTVVGDGGTAHQMARGTFGMTTGKWYWEVTGASIPTGAATVDIVGVQDAAPNTADGVYLGSSGVGTGRGYSASLTAMYATGFTTSGTVPALENATMGFAYDADNGKLWYRNSGGTWVQGDPAAGTSPSATMNTLGTTVFPAVSFYGTSGTWDFNFGQRPFANAAPSGTYMYLALCTQNLPDPAINKASQYFDAKLRSGTGAAYSVTGIGFQPDLVWIKARDAAYSHNIADTVNGAGYAQFSDQAIAQVSNHDITAFNSDGYSANQTVNYELSNGTPRNYIDWMWRGGGNANTFNLNGTGYASMAAAGLTDGSQAATGISVNTTCGMSVVNFSAAASGTGTIGHGLGVAPRLIIAKAKSSAYQWYIQHASQGPTKYGLFSTAAFAAATAVWNDTAPTSTVFSHGTGWNGYGTTVAYCFAEIAGFSKFGSYTGNGSANGPFVWCGFRPRWIMVKRTNTASSWFQIDTARDTYNRAQNYLKVDVADAEGVFGLVDLVSNGFKWREDGSASGMNVSASTYIFAAFAEHPFRTARAR